MTTEDKQITPEFLLNSIMANKTKRKYRKDLTHQNWNKSNKNLLYPYKKLNESQQMRKRGYSDNLRSMGSTRVNSFKIMQFQNRNGGIKVTNSFQNKIKPIRDYSNKLHRPKSISQNQKIQIYPDKPRIMRQQSSILDKSNLFLVPFLKNKVKKLSKLISKSSAANCSPFISFQSQIELVFPVQSNYKSISSKRCRSVIGQKKSFSYFRPSKDQKQIFM